MLSNKNWSSYGRHIYLLKRIRSIGLIFLSVLLLTASIFFIFHLKNGVTNERRELLRVWNEGDFNQSFEISKDSLINKPTDYFLLTINGFSAYQLGISQINNQSTLQYINECIFSLRKAIMQKEAVKDGRVFYVLGKAYGYKGREYSDLAVKYLEMANHLSYDAQDIPEYLGLSYAAYGDYRSSVAAFAQALAPDKAPSDNLLLSIARSYMAMNDYDMAQGYLHRCIETSADSRSESMARLLLGELYSASGDFDRAETQYMKILNETGENAEVRFQLGELYNMKGDSTRARSEWRMAYRQDPSHAKARARLNI